MKVGVVVGATAATLDETERVRHGKDCPTRTPPLDTRPPHLRIVAPHRAKG